MRYTGEPRDKGIACSDHDSYRRACVPAVASLGLIGGFAAPYAQARSAPAATTLGIWISAEDSGSYSTVPGQHPDVTNIYEYWGTGFPGTFAAAAEKAGATPFLEIEPGIRSS